MVTSRVAEIREEAEGIKSFRLVPRYRDDGLEAYEAGAHIDVTGPTGITRQYSLCGDDPACYLIAVKHEQRSRGGSAALHGMVRVGDELLISRPRNVFRLDRLANRHVLFAGGIGVTPLLAMSHQLAREGAPFTLNYFARSRQHAAFATPLGTASFSDRVMLHYGLSPEAQEAALRQVLTDPGSGAHVYVCGPAAFMTQVTGMAAAVLPAEHIHVEHFAAQQTAATRTGAFQVELTTGETFTVPADRTIAEVLEEGDIPIDTSCREGICGTCIASVREGVPDHRDNCLTAKEHAAGNRIALCVSRALTDRLVIEL